MPKKGHTEEQILAALHEGASGTRVAEVCRRMGTSQATYFLWKKKYAGPGGQRSAGTASVAGRERQVEAAGCRSFAGPAHSAGDRRKKVVKPRRRRDLAKWAQSAYQLSESRSSRLITVPRSSMRRKSRRDPQEALRMRLRELAGPHVRYGYRRLTVLLRREGWKVNAKRIYRLYTEEGLIVRTKQRKKLASRIRVPQMAATAPNQRWSMDFIQARLSDGRWFRVLTLVDQFTRECLLLHSDLSLNGQKVATALDTVLRTRSKPQSISCDNGTEFTSRAMDSWSCQQGVQLAFIRPGKPSRTATSNHSMGGSAMNA